ncbi:MAG TPA: SPFH domain-containing protein [Accumulibacter sp.]|uniref:prohibitin family protein n=1 Tax=Accumulibacter sp. TaxID=2053492 RepID=UPI002582EAFD|nr:SPFH domain-containing protein [Accumulibacter sp.]MCC2866456.1 prohibitin family protein [Candidatus Accumulibacter phosphatis]MCM8623660.1 SPFH domain-containing protein [Accumulibacter sp.]HNO12866.1 SPFH domain-containing protein [Accumulibacter sp.]
MSPRIKEIVESIRHTLGLAAARVAPGAARCGKALQHRGVGLMALAMLAAGGYTIYAHPPLQSIGRGEIGLRVNQFTGGSTEVRAGAVLIIPHLHELRRFSLRDQVYHPTGGISASGPAAFQSVEGLSLGVDISIRYSLDPQQISVMARTLPQDINGEIVEPVVQGVLYKTLARYTVREIFSSKRQEIQQAIEAELKPRLATDGITLESVTIGKVDLPSDYKAGMENLLAEELATEKMRYTLELKDKQVKQSELEAQAEKVRREKAAEAAGEEQIIAARAQAEAMKHVLPFKQKQIEQRGLEAEAEKLARIKGAEASAQARRIEAAGEADSRQKLADAEAYRQERIGRIASEQLARDGALISKNPLLIQKTLADKLSDKISVIIAPPPTDGGFIGATLLGSSRNGRSQAASQAVSDAQGAEESGEGGQ